MEIIVWVIIVILWWIGSTTILLPIFVLLVFNNHFCYWSFSFMYVYAYNVLLELMSMPVRKQAFDLLKEELSQKGWDNSKSLKVLEIGIAGGANLKLYPENTRLTALDVNVSFGPYFHKNQKKFPNITYERTVFAGAENMKGIEDCSMDIVVATYLLCSVNNVEDSLMEIKRVLKPGGKYLFLEHVAFPKSDWRYTLQKFANPLWGAYFGRCTILRSGGEAIKKAGFSNVICMNTFPKSIVILMRPQAYGIATK